MPNDARTDLGAGLAQLRAAREPAELQAQGRPVPHYANLTMRDLANAIVATTLRNGFLEELHAGDDSPLLADASLSRITDAEMKRLMIETSAQLAIVLHKFLEKPDEFEQWLAFARRYTVGWERTALRP